MSRNLHSPPAIYYKYTVRTKNTADPKKNLWIFENKTHDYPNIINYKLLNNNELTVATTNSNGNKKIEFVMKRTQ